jgi:prenyltransferase beta subunit
MYEGSTKPRKEKILALIFSVITFFLLIPNVNAYPIQLDNETIQNALNYLKTQQVSDGGFGDLSTTNWAVMAISSANEDPHTWIKNGKSPVDYMKAHANELSSALDYERFTLSIVATGENPENFNGINYTNEIKAFYDSINAQIGDPNLLNDDFWGILALVACNETNSIEVTNSMNFIKNNQNLNGGWSWGVNQTSDADDTAAAIMALIAAGEDPNSSVIQNALNYLKTQQADDGGFLSWGSTNAATDSWVIQAIVASEENITGENWTKNDKTAIDDLLSLQNDDGSFNWTNTSSLSALLMTSYAIPALLGKTYPIIGPKAITVNMRIEGQNSTIFYDNVTFGSSKIIDTDNKAHYLLNATAMGAVDIASKLANFPYKVNNTAWGLYLYSLNNEDAQGWDGWMG